ncbi:flagellar basal body-associated FliL family protein [Halanaerobaculum tunisiense]
MSDENQGISYILIVIIVLFSVVLASGASYFMLFQFGGLNSNQQVAEEATADKKLGPTTNLDQFLVNLADGREYVKMNISFEVSNQETVTEIEERKPQVRDRIISILRTKNHQQITSNQGTRKLRTEVMEQVNQILLKGKITNVFFTEFIVQ